MPIRMVGCRFLRRSSCAEWYSFAFYGSILLPRWVEIRSGRSESQIAYPRRVVSEGQVSDALGAMFGAGQDARLDAGGGQNVTRLAGLNALITGVGTGMGRAIALAFAREGAKVAVAARRVDKLEGVVREIEAAGGTGLAVECDVTRGADAEHAVRQTAEKFGQLNTLVNNAGVLSVSTVEGIAEDEWDRLMAANLKGPFLMSRAVLPEFRKVGGGVIVNIGSVLGLVAMKNRAAYCASKGGVTMLTKAMAMDHAHEGVRVNCICPSIVETELVRGLFDSSPEGEAARRARVATIPLGRIGQPEDVAEMAVYLASKESGWMTGVAIPLDGGLSAY